MGRLDTFLRDHLDLSERGGTLLVSEEREKIIAALPFLNGHIIIDWNINNYPQLRVGFTMAPKNKLRKNWQNLFSYMYVQQNHLKLEVEDNMVKELEDK